MTDLVADYEQFMRSWGAAETTIHARTKMARSRLRAWGVDGHTKGNIQAWLATDAEGKPRKAWTRSTYWGHLNSWCEFLVAVEALPANPVAEIRKPQRGSNTPRPLAKREEEAVLSIARGETRHWIVIALKTGMRVHEIAKMTGQDVQPEGIYVVGKGDKVEVLPCPPEVAILAQRYPRAGYWFPGGTNGHIHPDKITKAVSDLFDSLGIAGSIHRCRHSFATDLLRKGVHIRKVQKLMRHSSLATTANYTAVDEDELRAAIAELDVIDMLDEDDDASAA